MNADYNQVAFVAGSLFTRIQELRALLQELRTNGRCQGECHIFYRAADGQETELLIHIDGECFSMMPVDHADGFRLDASDMSLWLD